MTLPAILDRAAAGERISDEQALRLLEEGSLLDLGEAADRLRKAVHPDGIATYIVDRNINYTNVCAAGCRFCAFHRAEGHREAYVIDRDTLASKIRETIDLGGVQILLQGGHHPNLRLDWYEELLRWIKSNWKIHVHGFSAPEIHHFARIEGLPVREVLRRLQAAGLDTLPGGGAEILVDRVRSALARDRCTAGEWLDVHRAAHEMGMRTTATMVIGHIETLAERVEHLRAIRDLQDESRSAGRAGFTAFIMWTMQTEHTGLARLQPAGSHEYLRTLAVCRLFLDNIENLQASWVTQGGEIGQLALRFGANDMGSTMLEENVVSRAGATFTMDEARIRRVIREAGFTPKRRDCLYRLLE